MFKCNNCGNYEGFRYKNETEFKFVYNKKDKKMKKVRHNYIIGICIVCGTTAEDTFEVKQRESKKPFNYKTNKLQYYRTKINIEIAGNVYSLENKKYIKDLVSGNTYLVDKLRKLDNFYGLTMPS